MSRLLIIFILLQISHTTTYATQDSSLAWPKIIAEYKQLLAKHPNDEQIKQDLVSSYNKYAIWLHQQGQWQQSITIFEEALQISPSDILTRNLSDIYLKRGIEHLQTYQWQKARDMLSKALQLDNHPDKQKYLSMAYLDEAFYLFNHENNYHYTTMRHQQAYELAKKSQETYPKNPKSYELIGDIYYLNQQLSQAEQTWQQGYNLDSSYAGFAQRLRKVSQEMHVENNMQNELDNFFIIKISKDINKKDFNIKQALYSARTQVNRDFNYVPRNKIPVLVYDLATYQQTIQHAPAWSGGLYDGKLRIPVPTDTKDYQAVQSTIIHEYAHAIIHDLSNGSCPHWLNEGLAQYAEHRHAISPNINTLKTALNQPNSSPISWENLSSSFYSQDTHEVQIAYETAYLATYFLIVRHGYDKIINLLTELGKEVSFEAAIISVYHTDITTLESHFKIWLPQYLLSH